MSAAALDERAAWRVAPPYRLQWESAQNAWVLLYPEGMVQLNASAGEILRRLDGQTTLAQLVETLERDFPGACVRSDVQAFVAHAQDQRWITR